jgi:soluble lytic murein transglycosylase-like protein
MRKQQGFIGGLYAYLAIGAAVVAIGGYAAYQYQRAEAADVRASMAQARAEQLGAALQSSEEENAKLKVATKKLDAALVERDRRARALEETKRKIQGELDAIRETLPAPDRECLDRPLPPAILERLRDP